MRAVLSLNVALLLWLSASGVLASPELMRSTLDTLIERHGLALDGIALFSPPLLDAFYRERADRLAWRRVEQLRDLMQAAESSVHEGLSPDDFHGGLLRALELDPDALFDAPPETRVVLDLILTDALLRYVHHHRYGKLDPVMVDARHHDREPVAVEVLLAALHQVLDAEHLAIALERNDPPPFWYRRLRDALRSATAMSHLADLPPIPDGPLMGLGSRDARVAQVRERLQRINGEPLVIEDDARPFDAGLRKSVQDFQQRYGLNADGVVGPLTLAALNHPLDPGRIEQIRINLERMRWLYQDLPETYLFVDVAGFRVELIHQDQVRWSTRAIVGTSENQTPMFRDLMDHLVFNPTWTVPVSIQKTMGNISREHYLLVDRRSGEQVSGGDIRDVSRYQLVQKPGPKNALGRVKFMFPNRHAIYLHDTPARHLFGRERRAFSHGCVRVDQPLELAEQLLTGSPWNTERIEGLLDQSRTRWIDLKQPLPVLLYYLTAVADEQGRVAFRADFYERDPALREAFARPAVAGRLRFPPVPAPSESVGQVEPDENL